MTPAYVPAVPEPAQRQLMTQRQVTAQWSQNLGGGVGAATLVVAGWITVHGAAYGIGWTPDAWPDWGRVAIGAGVVGMVVFGGLMFLRSSIDEIMAASDWQRVNADLDAAIADVEALKVALAAERHRASVAELQRDTLAMRNARAPVVAVTPQPEDSQVWEDARAMVTRRWNGLKWGRDAMTDAGWTPTRWAEAMELLKLAQIAVASGRAMVPFDASVPVAVPLAMLAEFRQNEDAGAFRRFAAANDEATPEVATNTTTNRGRGGGD